MLLIKLAHIDILYYTDNSERPTEMLRRRCSKLVCLGTRGCRDSNAQVAGYRKPIAAKRWASWHDSSLTPNG